MSDDLTARVTARLTDADMFNVLSVDQRANTAVIAERMRKIILAAIQPELQDAERELGGLRHEALLIEANTRRGITDCSTPLFQRVRNIGEALQDAERRLAEAKQEIADAWWALGHAYADQYSKLADALKDIAVRLDKSENPPDWANGFENGKKTNELLLRGAERRLREAEAKLDSTMVRLGQEIQARSDSDRISANLKWQNERLVARGKATDERLAEYQRQLDKR